METYSIETIEEAKRLHIDEGYSIRRTATALGIKAPCTISLWKKKYDWKKSSPDYPVKSLKAQLTRVTVLVDKLEPELEKIDILKPSTQHKEILANYRRLSELQLKLIKQLGVLKPLDNQPSKSNIFM